MDRRADETPPAVKGAAAREGTPDAPAAEAVASAAGADPTDGADRADGADPVTAAEATGVAVGGAGGAAGELRALDMAAAPMAVRPCSIAAALEILGERWSLLALREMAYGVHRFARIAGYTGASRDILADRLRKLEEAGVVERRRYSEHPPRYEYHLTRAGRELFPLMFSLLRWGDRWAVDTPAVDLRHDCGQVADADLVCAHCGDPVTRESLTPVRHR
ncbi:transcriptional regulator, HxlR family [Actinacidiphila yanglinensis]|uniref:Transcriptional regulator, HxlR family n=1 Tax=Actinacidiphila yanglinensis TaxID=310779 RepID=A0A1H6AZ05_9ACTN|nr:helix-turn-helix domain-containing protein [Actinacidiphila yanglinensis]SEG53853.1 transcriptional regulator, HxlR family [Actinacidiphila yanglinensis]